MSAKKDRSSEGTLASPNPAHKPGTTKRAKLFKNGSSQAIRLPKEFRFEGEGEVEIKKVGGFLIISKVETNPWASFLKSLELFAQLDEIERDQPDYTDKRVEF